MEQEDQKPATELIHTVLEGTFMPISCLAANGNLTKTDLNTIIFDKNQGACMIHYIGHFGDIKALRYFTEHL